MVWKIKSSHWAVTPVIITRARLLIFICQGYREEKKKMFPVKIVLSLYHSLKVFVLL